MSSTLYVEVADLKKTIVVDDVREDEKLAWAVESACRGIDEVTGRRFYLDDTATARTFRPLSDLVCLVDDIGDATGVIVEADTDDTGTFGAAWTVGVDYVLEPANAIAKGRPYTRIRAVGAKWFPLSISGRLTVRATAKWGWPTVPATISGAARIQAIRLFKRPSSPEGQMGFGEMGPVRIAGVDPDVARMVNGSIRIAGRYA